MRSRPAVCVRWYQCTNLCSYIAGATARNDTSGEEEGFIHIQKNKRRRQQREKKRKKKRTKKRKTKKNNNNNSVDIIMIHYYHHSVVLLLVFLLIIILFTCCNVAKESLYQYLIANNNEHNKKKQKTTRMDNGLGRIRFLSPKYASPLVYDSRYSKWLRPNNHLTGNASLQIPYSEALIDAKLNPPYTM